VWFRLPSVSEIQQFITQLFAKEKKTAQEESAEANEGQLVVDGSDEELDDHEEVSQEGSAPKRSPGSCLQPS
jgi:hypothetical protein